MMKTNILLVGISIMPSYVLTVRDFQRYANELKFNLRCKFSRNINASDLNWCDILVCVRGNDPLSAYLIRKAKTLEKKIILVLDDDLLCFDDNCHPIVNRIAKKSLVEVLKQADVMITTSKFIGDKYYEYFNLKYLLVDTIVEPDEIDSPKESSKIIKLVYAAGAGHSIFFETLISPFLGLLSDRYSKKISLTFIGLRPEVRNVSFAVEYVDSMPFTDYQDFMREMHFDIGLAPLFDSELCKSKYYNKYIEYSKHGICGIYSNVCPYNLVIEDKVNGVLADNDKDTWYRVLCEVIDNKLLRKMCVENSQKHMLESFSLHNIVSRLKTEIPFINKYKSPHVKAIRLRPMFLYLIYCEIRRRSLNFIYKKELL